MVSQFDWPVFVGVTSVDDLSDRARAQLGKVGAVTIPEEPETGTLVRDTGSSRVGVVMGHVGPYVQLRAPGGGVEWDVDPAKVVPADDRDRLHAKVAEANAASRRVVR